MERKPASSTMSLLPTFSCSISGCRRKMACRLSELMSHGEPKPRIIVMTTYESEGDVRRALKAGAKGYLVKGADPQQIREAVRKVAAGQSLLQPEIASKLAESMARPELSERELQVLQSMALGRSNKEIGQVLYISENTVKGHVKSILTKLDLK